MAYDIDTIRHANTVRGHFFFERGALRFFRSRIGRTVYEGDGGIFFVTSEQFVPSTGIPAPRRYTVRRFYPATGDIETQGPFNTMTASEARRYARLCAAVIPTAEKHAREVTL